MNEISVLLKRTCSWIPWSPLRSSTIWSFPRMRLLTSKIWKSTSRNWIDAFINSMFELLFFFRIFILFLSIVTNNTYLHNVLQIELQNPCRQGKKLLVLDIDYTLFDHRSTAENPLQLMRPCNFISPLPSLLAFPFKNAIFNHWNYRILASLVLSFVILVIKMKFF